MLRVEARVRVLPGAALIFMLFAPTVNGQTHESRGAAGGLFGVGQTWDDEGSIGTGAVIGGRVEWRVFGTTAVEFSLDVLSHDRQGQFFEANGHMAFTGVSFLHRFGSSAAQPYVLGGLHLATHSGSTRFEDLRVERTSTDFGYHFGGGIGFGVGNRLEIGPEVRFYMIQPENDSDPATAYWIGGRLGIRF